MIGIDTNVLVRYLKQHDEQHAIITTNIIKHCKNNPGS